MELKDKHKQWKFTFTSTEKGVYTFKYNPLEWQETEYSLMREDKGGIMFTFSGDYTYTKDPYSYVKDGFNTYGILWNCYLTIEYLNNFSQQYETFVNLKKLDFSSVNEEDSENGLTFKIPLTDSGFYENIKTYEDVEIPYSRLETLSGSTITPFANEYEDVTVYGVEIESVGNGTGDEISHRNPSGYNYFSPGIIMESSNPDIKSPYFTSHLTSSAVLTNSTFLFKSESSTATVTVDLSLDWIYVSSRSVALFFIVFSDNLDGTYTLISETTIGSYANGDRRVSTYSDTLSLNKNEGFGIYYLVFDDDADYYLYDTSVITINCVQKAEQTILKHVSVMQLHKRLIHSMTDQADSFVSSVFDTEGKWEHLYFSNGYLYRQFTTDEAQLTFKWKELQDNMRKMLNVEYGMIVDGGVKKIICEDKSYFYNNTVGHILTDIKRNSFVRELDINLFYSSIAVGTPKKDYEETGALKSYANLCNYSTCLNTLKNELDLVTSYFVDPIWAETARRLPKTATETTDSPYDNDIFILETIDSGGLIQRTTEDFDIVSGIDEVTTPMNLNLTPARCFFRHGPDAGIGLQKNLDKLIKFNKSEIKNTLSTVRSDESITVSENVDIDPNDLEVPYLTGFKIKVLADVTMQKISLIEADPYKTIQLPNTIDGGNSQIFLNSISNKPIGESLSNLEGYESGVATIPTAKYWKWLDGNNIEWVTGDGIELLQ